MTFHFYSNGKRIAGDFWIAKLQEEEIGVFESLRTYGRGIFHEKEHLARLAESAKTVGFKIPSLKELSAELQLAIKAFDREVENVTGDLFIRLTLFNHQTFVMVGERKHSPKLYEKGIALKTSPVRRSLSNAAPPEVKTSAYQNAVLASLEVSEEDTYEWVFLDRDGFVTEVRIGNLFIVRHDELLTPPLMGILNGVTRQFVIKCALQAGIKVKETPLTRHEIYNAQEAFLTNTSWEILPVRELDRRKIGQELPGKMTRKLQNLFRKKIHEKN